MVNKKQINDFDLNPNPADDDSILTQTAAGTTERTNKSSLLNDVNTSLVGLQTQIDNLDFTYATDTILAAISGDIQDQIDNLDDGFATDAELTALETSIQKSWFSLVNSWTAEPSLNINISGGDVYNYVYGGTTYYRFVPEPYDSTLDSFYSAFDGSNLTGAIATRGQTI